jgi:hypothetical protein
LAGTRKRRERERYIAQQTVKILEESFVFRGVRRYFLRDVHPKLKTNEKAEEWARQKEEKNKKIERPMPFF